MDGPTYTRAVSGGPLRQGEVLSSIVQYFVQVSNEEAGNPARASGRMHPFAIVLAQDCDLAQDYAGRQNEVQLKLLIPNILMCEVDLAENLKGDEDRIARGSDIWKRVRQNQDDRFQYIREIAPDEDVLGEGVAPLLVDFKRTFTLTTDGLYAQLQRDAKRRAVLTSPYREQLSSRHAHFISRVALPCDHYSQP